MHTLLRRAPARGLAALALGFLLASGAFAAGAEDPVVVSRGGSELHMSEIDARLDEVPTDRRAGLMNSPERIDAILNQLLLLDQLAGEAVEQGLESDPRLARQLSLVRNRLLAQFRLEQLREQAAKSFDAEALARERYAANADAYTLPETRTVRHVLFSASKRGEATARADADAAARRIAAGETLAAIARETSDDTATRDGGGLIAGIAPGQTDPDFENAMMALAAPGAVTAQPVRSSYGWHLIELVSIEPARRRTFDEMRSTLVAEVSATTVDQLVKAHTDRLNNLPLEADPDLVASLRTRYVVPAEEGAAPAPPATASPDADPPAP